MSGLPSSIVGVSAMSSRWDVSMILKGIRVGVKTFLVDSNRVTGHF